MINKDDALKMYIEGATLQEIATKYGVSKQRINQVIRPIYNGWNFRHVHSSEIPLESEIYIANKLKKLGHKVTYKNHQDLYDLFVDTEIRIEVKQRKTIFNKNGSYYYHFNQIEPKFFDLLIAICGELKTSVCYIIPSYDCHANINIPFEPKFNTKLQRKYRESWNLIGKKGK
jgi:hypothetical protein